MRLFTYASKTENNIFKVKMAKILFIQKVWFEWLGIMQLSAVLKKGCHKSFLYVDSGNPDKLIQYVKNGKFDVVGFSVVTGHHLWALQIGDLLKRELKENMPLIVFGGPHPTFVPEIIEDDSVDVVCRGEGEEALLELMNAIDNKRDYSTISNLWIKKNGEIIKNKLRPLIDNLDLLPFPDRDLFYQYSYFKNNPNKTVMASRGCPFNCSFCFNEKYRQLYKIDGSSIRRRSCENVIEEIKQLKTKYKSTKMIRFQDDIFTLDRKWLNRFLEIYKREINIPFECYIKADLIDEETIKKLGDGGCIRTLLGLETGNENLRSGILNKKVLNSQFYNAAALLKKYKIPFTLTNMFFIPGSTIKDVWETVEMNQKMRPKYVAANVFQPYPGTEMAESLLKKNLININYLDSIKDIYSFSVFESMDANQEKNIFYLFWVLIKLPYLTPIIKLLVKCKPNILFLLVHKGTMGISSCLRHRLGFTRLIREIYYHRNFKNSQ